MAPRFPTTFKYTAFFSLIFLFALSFASATVTHYSSSKTFQRGRGGTDSIVFSGKDRIHINLVADAVDAYLDEQGINEVTITTDLVEQWIDTGNGTGYYKLDFTFGPSGCHFTPEMKLHLKGKYVSDATEVQLFDENGEALPATRNTGADSITFYIPHFSNYYYEGYY